MADIRSNHIFDYGDTLVQPMQALVTVNKRPFVHHGNDLAEIRGYQHIHALLFSVLEDGAGVPFRQFFTDVPPSLVKGNIGRLIWREKCIAFSLHELSLSTASLFMQELTAVMVAAKRNRMYSSAFIAQEEVRQRTILVDVVNFSKLIDMSITNLIS